MTKPTKQDVWYVARVALILLVICAFVAVLLAGVHLLTRDRIAAAKQAATDAAIAALFADAETELVTLPTAVADVTAVYAVTQNESAAGYAVAVAPQGYKDAVSMLVGITPDGCVCGVQVVSHSETSGIGTRVLAADYLARYTGLSGALTLGNEVDGVTGATVTSRAVLVGVNAALAAVRTLQEGVSA